jgi:membrane-associated phospholipid phosphatase
MAINLVLEYLDSKRKKPLYIMIAVILTIFVPFSRIYLGAHSINQVLQGLFLGFCMVYLYSWGGLKKKIDCLLSTDDYS